MGKRYVVQHWHAIRLYRLNQDLIKCWYSHEPHLLGHMGSGHHLYFMYWEKPSLEAGDSYPCQGSLSPTVFQPSPEISAR